MIVTHLIAELTELAQCFGKHVEVVMPPRPLRMDQSLEEREVDRPVVEAKYEQGKIYLR